MNSNQNENIKHALNLTHKMSETNDEEGLFNYFCSKIYSDAETIAATNKNIYQFPKDLFIEQCKYIVLAIKWEYIGSLV